MIKHFPELLEGARPQNLLSLFEFKKDTQASHLHVRQLLVGAFIALRATRFHGLLCGFYLGSVLVVSGEAEVYQTYRNSQRPSIHLQTESVGGGTLEKRISES